MVPGSSVELSPPSLPPAPPSPAPAPPSPPPAPPSPPPAASPSPAEAAGPLPADEPSGSLDEHPAPTNQTETARREERRTRACCRVNIGGSIPHAHVGVLPRVSGRPAGTPSLREPTSPTGEPRPPARRRRRRTSRQLLTTALSRGELSVRRATLRLSLSLPPHDGRRMLLAALHDRDPVIAIASAQALLRRAGSEDASALIDQTIGHPLARVRALALDAALRHEVPEAIAALRRALFDDARSIREVARHELSNERTPSSSRRAIATLCAIATVASERSRANGRERGAGRGRDA